MCVYELMRTYEQVEGANPRVSQRQCLIAAGAIRAMMDIPEDWCADDSVVTFSGMVSFDLVITPSGKILSSVYREKQRF